MTKPKKIRKPRVIPKCVASHYEHDQERIIEFSFPGVDNLPGGLISFFHHSSGELVISLYSLEGPLTIHVGSDELHDITVAEGYKGRPDIKIIPKPKEAVINDR